MKTYISFTYGSVHFRFTPNLKVHRSPLSLRFSIIIFKTIYFHLKVGMRLKVFHNESNTKFCVVEIH